MRVVAPPGRRKVGAGPENVPPDGRLTGRSGAVGAGGMSL